MLCPTTLDPVHIGVHFEISDLSTWVEFRKFLDRVEFPATIRVAKPLLYAAWVPILEVYAFKATPFAPSIYLVPISHLR